MIEIIPAIDIIEGKCVRLTQGDFSQKKIYNEDPVEVAKMFQDAGLTRLHLVDLDGAKQGRIVNLAVLKSISKSTSLKIDFGGGIKTDDDAIAAFDNGAEMITAGSIAVTNRKLVEKWFSRWGAEKIILGADVKNNKIATHGWQNDTGIDLYEFYESYRNTGFAYSICTDVSKDGLLQGPATELYKNILKRIPGIKLIASGGVSSVEDIKQLENTGVFGVIIGKALYEKKIMLNELKFYQKQ